MPHVPLREHLEMLVKQLDRRLEQERADRDKALSVAEDNNRHWKEEADAWRRRADERERNFLPRSMGTVLAVISVIALLLGLWERVFS